MCVEVCAMYLIAILRTQEVGELENKREEYFAESVQAVCPQVQKVYELRRSDLERRGKPAERRRK